MAVGESCAIAVNLESVGIGEMTSICPEYSLPCPVNKPAFKPNTVKVRSAFIAQGSTCPVLAAKPLGISIAIFKPDCALKS